MMPALEEGAFFQVAEPTGVRFPAEVQQQAPDCSKLVSPVAHLGYLFAEKGERLQVLYVGTEDNEGWAYVTAAAGCVHIGSLQDAQILASVDAQSGRQALTEDVAEEESAAAQSSLRVVEEAHALNHSGLDKDAMTQRLQEEPLEAASEVPCWDDEVEEDSLEEKVHSVNCQEEGPTFDQNCGKVASVASSSDTSKSGFDLGLSRHELINAPLNQGFWPTCGAFGVMSALWWILRVHHRISINVQRQAEYFVQLLASAGWDMKRGIFVPALIKLFNRKMNTIYTSSGAPGALLRCALEFEQYGPEKFWSAEKAPTDAWVVVAWANEKHEATHLMHVIAAKKKTGSLECRNSHLTTPISEVKAHEIIEFYRLRLVLKVFESAEVLQPAVQAADPLDLGLDDDETWPVSQLRLNSETEYEGGLRDGRFHGEGTLSTADSTYQGQFRYGLRHGEGTSVPINDSSMYKGEFLHDLPHGQGVWSDGHGLTYKGEFVNGSWHGRGTCVYADGRAMKASGRTGSGMVRADCPIDAEKSATRAISRTMPLFPR